MGKITNALKKAAEERLQRIDKIVKIQEYDRVVVKKMGTSNIDSRIISYFDPKSPITEQYKVLRTNILSLNKGKPPKTIVLTSSIHSEGKSVTTLNLAIAMAQSINKPKILLIDADLRRGKLVKYLGTKQDVGLTEILSGRAQYESALFNIDIENLTLMASGAVPPNPVELLASENMKNLLQDLKMKYDYVLIDTPPLISVTDACILGAQADGVLLIVQAGRTQRGIVSRSTELLNQAHAKLLGYVLTSIEYHLPEYIYRYL